MKHLVLKELQVENFQKFQSETFSFGKYTVICGENRAGKTTVQSAMLWLLFGKDAYGQTDTGRGAFDIKRRENGQTIPHTDVTVQGTFQLTDGNVENVIVLKRVLHECWNKRNEYTGDETQCFVDDIPYKVGDYQQYISEIINEEEFRMISTVGYFNSLKTDFKRNYLCTMAGVQSIEDIVSESGNNKWKQFLKDISGKSLDDAIKQLSFERKQLKKQYEAIDPQIQALQKVKPEESNWEQIDLDIENCKKELHLVESSLNNACEAIKNHQATINELQKKSSEKHKEFFMLTKQINEAKQKALAEARNELYKKDEELRDKQNKLKSAESTMRSLEIAIETYTTQIELCNKDMKTLMDSYNDEQAQVFSYNNDLVICPLLKEHVCQSPEIARMMEENKEKALAEYNTRKHEKLELIMKQGRTKKEHKTELELELNKAKESLAQNKQTIEALTTVISSMPVYSNTDIDESNIDIPGKKELEEKRIAINAEITELEKKADMLSMSFQTEDNNDLKKRKTELNTRIESLIKEASKCDQISKIEQEIDRLNSEGTRLAAQINELDQRELTAKDISRAIMEDATERVNKLFDIVTWQMFELQKNGLYAEVCKPCINGVSNSLNSEARINIGIDICNAISIFKGFSAPLFIDNAESVNELISSVGQRIEMYVAPKGVKLSITNH